ncbi:hypothetical protein MGYG_03215 [Nannizzia gypsea CBS 118893]|uniref:Uncharacterized protein n=1 Tax=Arthroderma gypseum (strain ATCC MYA-4604 / CBS 118893) TaxID=535722 RepID=E4URK2_ARTGP|nr:hypothetical protein MGYG_03215 [Nannizzia gypsea CBS 118893]EFR00212.1 hypothetical protein MGYG_03215 [Nannizzia gypsea CBS 118893]
MSRLTTPQVLDGEMRDVWEDPGPAITLRARDRGTDASHDRRWNNQVSSSPLILPQDVKLQLDIERNEDGGPRGDIHVICLVIERSNNRKTFERRLETVDGR